jgi:subtilase family serine protease
MFKHHVKVSSYGTVKQAHAYGLVSKATRKWFYANELATIYKFPPPTENVVVGVVSFGGGLFGNVSAEGVLTGGDVQAYWTSLGITDHPHVIVKTIGGARNTPISADDDGTAENTLDVETIGACCPSSKLTIILYLAPNTLSQFTNVMNSIMNVPVVANGVSYTPSIVSISWGAPEIEFGSLTTAVNNVLATAVSRGISVFVATGDDGSNNGVGGSGTYVDFPSSSPNVIACGGTSLICPNNIYDSNTREVAWSKGGGGVSVVFSKPSYQSSITASGRSTPDISANADPQTGVAYYVDKSWYVYGGTSVAAPTIAAYFACMNCKVFATPWLYKAPPSAFHDIKVGANGKYSTRIGHDNCTGFGSIVGNVLSNSFGSKTVVAAGLIINITSTTIAAGNTAQLSCAVIPTTATNRTIAWTSNSSAATVSNTGLVTAVSTGIAIITASTTDGTNISVSTRVTIPSINVSSVSLNATHLALGIGQPYTLVPTVLPTNATNKSCTYASSNPSVVSVSLAGALLVQSLGKAILTVTSVDQKKQATCVITVS